MAAYFNNALKLLKEKEIVLNTGSYIYTSECLFPQGRYKCLSVAELPAQEQSVKWL